MFTCVSFQVVNKLFQIYLIYKDAKWHCLEKICYTKLLHAYPLSCLLTMSQWWSQHSAFCEEVKSTRDFSLFITGQSHFFFLSSLLITEKPARGTDSFSCKPGPGISSLYSSIGWLVVPLFKMQLLTQKGAN